jgi:uncharacterized SAM-dependent methyltransferase
LEKVKKEAMEIGDTFLVGIDRRNEAPVVKLAYDDPKGITKEFIMNGLEHVDKILKNGVNDVGNNKILDRTKFEYISIYNNVLGRHEAYYRSLAKQSISIPLPSEDGIATTTTTTTTTIDLEEGELISIEYSVKYSPDEVEELVDLAGLYQPGKWTESGRRYDVHLFQKPPFAMGGLEMMRLKDKVELGGNKNQVYRGVPTLEEFEELWKLW